VGIRKARLKGAEIDVLDIHAGYLAAGSTTLVAASAVGFTNDTGTWGSQGSVPIQSNATLIGWGAMATAVADSIKEVKLIAQDENDVVNYSDYKLAGVSTQIVSPFFEENLPFVSGGRIIQLAQTAAAAAGCYFIDYYNTGNVVNGSYTPRNRNFYTQTAGQANVAGAWTSTLFSPAGGPPPVGRYALLGAWLNNSTATTGFNLLAFSHPGFGAYHPGFLCVDSTVGTLTAANYGEYPAALRAGYQFVSLSELTGAPQCPTFTVTATSTNLLIWTGSLNTDTPNVILNIAKVG
jgi:hypothetical protein